MVLFQLPIGMMHGKVWCYKIFSIKGHLCFVKISQDDSPTQVAVLSAFLANDRR